LKRRRKVGKKERMLRNRIFRMKRRETNRVKNKYENNMEKSLDPPATFYLFNISPLHFPTSYISLFHPLPPIPPLSLSQDTPFVVS
jgi:hypothetical protein